MEPIYWLIAFVVLSVIEGLTLALTTMWFAGGAAAAFLVCLAGASVNAQLAVFAAVSFALLAFIRPWAVKNVNRHATKTNVDSLVGMQARVTEEIDNVQGTGTAVINGQEWTARAEKDADRYFVGEMVEVGAIQGVKLIVRNRQKEG